MKVSTLSFQELLKEPLSQVETRMQAQAEGSHPDLAAAVIHLLKAGGKRIRPMVTLLTGLMFGGQPERLVTLAAAIEMLHTATLVHDDLIDGALLRRGMATLNAQWSPAATVLTGDFVFARAAKLAADTDSVQVMKMFAETLTTIVNGEINQFFTSRGIASREDYFQRIYAKTASMFELATGAAAELSQIRDSLRGEARRFGFEIGMAFQLMDDILDFTGDQAAVGKPLANDLRQGLITLPTLYYLEAHPDDPDLQSVLHRNGYNDQMHRRLVEAIRSSGAIQKAHQEAIRYVQRGIQILSGFPNTPERAALGELAEFVVYRDL